MQLQLSDALNEYLLNISNEEPELLQALRAKTKALDFNTRMLVGPLEGQFLSLLVKLSRPQRCLEVGTFTGYSALCIGAALGESGTLMTLELNEKHADIASQFIAKAAYGHKINVRLGDATHTIPELDGHFDFIFVDADKGNYPLYYELLIPKLNKGGLMVVDNALWRGEVIAPENNQSRAIDALNQMAKEDERVETLLLPIRDGMLLVNKL